MTIGKFGTVSFDTNGVQIYATHLMLWDWSHRPGHAWPCSTLDDCDELTARFDRNGLVELEHPGQDDLDGSEFNAWSSDVLRDVLPQDHPAWFVTVGQFDPLYDTWRQLRDDGSTRMTFAQYRAVTT